ncbi:uncharacterized protein BDZ99DRAFT_567771 [Mytilinidion resinicola]|uniref:Uncharacterized protein n=1 Tax=Mytilinidion resinicola TaxID=574789 RepID=A0A6A6YYT4_9PEZI|nr:uncharacterized protein BDZ99DRAFT_567771 [Mytilinidion resinicola]KAF2814082.1 hypothetical protein BDZ99DRAFT_567771 [Mytilinidion resinicola]
MHDAPPIRKGTIEDPKYVEDEMRKICETLEKTPRHTGTTNYFPPAPTTPYGPGEFPYGEGEEEEEGPPSRGSGPDLSDWDVLQEECCLEGQPSTQGNSPVNAKIPQESFNGPWSLAFNKARETARNLGGIAKEVVTSAGVGGAVVTVSKAALVTAAMGATRAADKMGPEVAQRLYTVRQTVGLASREYGPAPGERAEMREAREKARKEREKRKDEKMRFPNGTPPPTAAEVAWQEDYSRMTSPRPASDRRDSRASSTYSRPTLDRGHSRASSTYLTSPYSRPTSVIQHRRKSTAVFETPAAPLLVNQYTPETPSPLTRLHSNRVAEQRQLDRSQLKLSHSEEPETPLPARVSQQQVYEQTHDIDPPHRIRFDDNTNLHDSPKEEDTYKEDRKSSRELAAPSEVNFEERRAWQNERDDMEARGDRVDSRGGFTAAIKFVGHTTRTRTTETETTTMRLAASEPIMIPSRMNVRDGCVYPLFH